MSQSSDTRFQRSSRLTNAFDYTRVFEKNSRSSDRYFTILFRENSGSDSTRSKSGSGKNLNSEIQVTEVSARLGLAVAKKCAKRAVDRNRLKRLARESFRQHKQSLAGFDIVLLARHASVPATNQELLKSLEKHWSRVAPGSEK